MGGFQRLQGLIDLLVRQVQHSAGQEISLSIEVTREELSQKNLILSTLIRIFNIQDERRIDELASVFNNLRRYRN